MIKKSTKLYRNKPKTHQKTKDEKMNYETIILKKEDGIATITLNRPQKRNAVNPKMLEELIDATYRVGCDPTIKVAVLTGAGKAFMAGGDLNELIPSVANGPFELRNSFQKGGQIVLNLRNMTKPVIAAVNGPAFGGGCSVALSCDIILASEHAKFNASFVNVGIHPDSGLIYFLPRLIGIAKACEMIFTGETIDAKEAERIGLVNRVVPARLLYPMTNELAKRLARGPSVAIGLAKVSLYQGLTMDLISVLEAEARAQSMCFLTEDFKEGINAFREKRKPRFKGR